MYDLVGNPEEAAHMYRHENDKSPLLRHVGQMLGLMLVFHNVESKT